MLCEPFPSVYESSRGIRWASHVSKLHIVISKHILGQTVAWLWISQSQVNGHLSVSNGFRASVGAFNQVWGLVAGGLICG